MIYRIEIAQEAFEALSRVSDRRVREDLARRIDALKHDPEKQGKSLGGELAGYRSLRASAQRYRILYRVESRQVVILVLTVGLRKEGHKKDIYELAKKLLRAKLV